MGGCGCLGMSRGGRQWKLRQRKLREDVRSIEKDRLPHVRNCKKMNMTGT